MKGKDMTKNTTKKNTTTEDSIDINERIAEELFIDSLEEEETYKPASLMFIPDAAKQLFEEQGFDVYWVRIFEPRTQGSLDANNIQKKEQEGYTFVKRSDVPGLSSALISYFGKKLNEGDHGLYVVGNNALAKIKKSKIAAKRQYLDQITKSRSQAIMNDLRKNNVLPGSIPDGEFRTTRTNPKMPKTSQRQVSFGKTGREAAKTDSDE